MTVNSMFPTCFNPGNLLLSFQTNFCRIISWKPAIFHSANWDGLCDYLLDSDLCLCKEESDVEDIWFIFTVLPALRVKLLMFCCFISTAGEQNIPARLYFV